MPEQPRRRRVQLPSLPRPGRAHERTRADPAIFGAAGTVSFPPRQTPFGQPPRVLPVRRSICQTDPTTGAGLAAPTPPVTLAVAQNQTVTFTVFVTRTST